MHHWSRGPSSGQCSASCQKTSNVVDPSARWERVAQEEGITFFKFFYFLWFLNSVSPHRTFTFQFDVAILLTHFSLQGSQFSKHSSVSDSSQHTFLRCPSSSSYDVYVEEACEVVLAASGQEVVSDSYYLHTQTAALQNEDLRLLLELSSSEFVT